MTLGGIRWSDEVVNVLYEETVRTSKAVVTSYGVLTLAFDQNRSILSSPPHLSISLLLGA